MNNPNQSTMITALINLVYGGEQVRQLYTMEGVQSGSPKSIFPTGWGRFLPNSVYMSFFLLMPQITIKRHYFTALYRYIVRAGFECDLKNPSNCSTSGYFNTFSNITTPFSTPLPCNMSRITIYKRLNIRLCELSKP